MFVDDAGDPALRTPRCLLAKCSGAVCTNVGIANHARAEASVGSRPCCASRPVGSMLRPLATHCDSRAFCGKPARLDELVIGDGTELPSLRPCRNLLDKYDLDADEALIKPQLAFSAKPSNSQHTVSSRASVIE